MSDKTCNERIKEALESRESYLEEVYEAIDFGEEYEDRDPRDELSEFGIGMDKVTVVKIHLSAGGPADWIEAELYEQKHGFGIQSLKYHYSDWFDHAERTIYTDSPLYRFAEEIIENISY